MSEHDADKDHAKEESRHAHQVEKSETTAKLRKFRTVTGFRDILPIDSPLWNYVEQTARQTFATFGFAEIRSPIVEHTEIFARAIGADTDIVAKEMYTISEHLELGAERAALTAQRPSFSDLPLRVRYVVRFTFFVNKLDQVLTADDLLRTDVNVNACQRLKETAGILSQLTPVPVVPPAARKGPEGPEGRAWDTTLATARRLLAQINLGEDVTLRPEATVSVVRAYIEHGMQMLPGNAKLYYMGPMFRRERPQKGRYRQFYQIGAEVLGSSDAPGIDAEVIEMLMRLFERLKLKGAILNINSIGCKTCRPAYVETLRAELLKVREQLGEDSKRRIETNPLRVLDSKLEHEQAIIEKLPRIAEHLCNDCRVHYDEVKRQLGLRGITFLENWRLVRGLDYYMRTTFEITAPGLGSQNAVCGGGRYDGLVELLGGPASTKGIGFAIGTDRLILSLQEAGEGAVPSGFDVYLAWFGAAAQSAAIGLARRLRDAGFIVELPAAEMKFGKSLGLADRLKARHAVIMGDDELAAGIVTVKRLADGSQQKLAEPELFAYLLSEHQA